MRTEVLIHELGISMAAIKHTGTDKLKLNGKLDHELPLFSFSSIETSTGYFSNANKLGQGGFGPVYKVKFKFQIIMNREFIFLDNI